MLLLLFSLIFLVALALFMLVGMLKGRTYAWYYSALKLGGIVVAALMSAALSVIIAKITSSSLCALVLNLPDLREVRDTIGDLPVLEEAAGALMAMAFAPILFGLLFWILKAVLRSVAYHVSANIALDQAKRNEETKEALEALKRRRKQKRQALRAKGVNPFGMLCGALCGFALCLVLCIPTVGALTVADHMIDVIAPLAGDSVAGSAREVSDALNQSAGPTTVRSLGGNLLYSFMTTYRVGDERVSLLKETEFLSVTGEAVASVKDAETDRSEAAAQILGVGDSFRETSLLPTLLSETLHVANEKWAAGDTFFGMNKPSAGGELDEIIDPTLEILGDADADTVREDVKTLAEVVAILVERDALSRMVENPLILFEDQDMSELVIYELLDNGHMSPLMGEVASFGIHKLGNVLMADMSDVHLSTANIHDKEHEAHMIAHTLSEAVKMIHYMEDHSEIDMGTLKSLGTFLDALAETEMAGKDNTDRILSHLLCSEKVYSSVGFTEAQANSLANKINSGANKGGYAPLMQSVAQTVEVLQITNEGETSSKEMNEKVEAMIQDLTPESAEVLQELASPEIMQNHGVPEKSAEGTSNMVSNMFGNLADAKAQGMSEEEYQKEAKATSDLLNIAMGAGKSGTTGTFGEGSATGKTAAELLDNVMDSKVISKTVVEAVYSDENAETPVVNPLNMSKELQDSEKQELLDAMNSKWNQASDAERTDAEYQKQYVAIGSLLNLPISVTQSGIVLQQIQ